VSILLRRFQAYLLATRRRSVLTADAYLREIEMLENFLFNMEKRRSMLVKKIFLHISSAGHSQGFKEQPWLVL